MLLLALGLAAAAPAAAQTTRLDWAWTASMGRPDNGIVYPQVTAGDLVAAQGGGAVVAGQYVGYVALGTGPGDTLRTAGFADGMLVKYSATGQKQWAVTMGGAGETYVSKFMQDRQGRYFCVVPHEVGITDPAGGALPGRGTAWFRYSAGGAFLGAGALGTVSPSQVNDDAAGNVVLSGTGQGDVLGTVMVGQINRGASFVAKLGPTLAPLWVQQITGTGSGSGTIGGQAVLPNGDVLVGGNVIGNATLDAAHQFVGNLGFLACYNGATGAIRWARTASVYLKPLVDPASGQAYVYGTFAGALNLDGIVATAPPANPNVLIARLDGATGRGQSLVFAGGGSQEQRVSRISCQPGGGFLVDGGGLPGVDFGADFGAQAVPPFTSVGYLLQLTAQGVPYAFYLGGGPAVVDALSVLPYTVGTARFPVRIGQLPVVVPRGSYEVVLAHIGLVLGTKTAAAATAAGLHAYPNPAAAAGPLTLACAAWPTAAVRLLDALGRPVWAGALVQGRAVLPPLNLPPGCYVVQARQGGRTAALRVLIE